MVLDESSCDKTCPDRPSEAHGAQAKGLRRVTDNNSDTESDTESRYDELRTDTVSYSLIRCR